MRNIAINRREIATANTGYIERELVSPAIYFQKPEPPLILGDVKILQTIILADFEFGKIPACVVSYWITTGDLSNFQKILNAAQERVTEKGGVMAFGKIGEELLTGNYANEKEFDEGIALLAKWAKEDSQRMLPSQDLLFKAA